MEPAKAANDQESPTIPEMMKRNGTGSAETRDSLTTQEKAAANAADLLENSSKEEAYGFTPGDTVLVKIQGFPWWPAIVVTPEHFPMQALAARPPSKTRKDGSSALCYPIQFLGTPEYYWAKPVDMKKLPVDDAKAWLSSGKKANTKGLKAAYQEVLQTPTLQELLEFKLKIDSASAEQTEVNGQDPAEEEEEDDGTELDDEGKPIKKKKKSKKFSRTPKSDQAITPQKRRKSDLPNGESLSKKIKPSNKKAASRTSMYEGPVTPELSPEEAQKRSWDNKIKTVMYLRHKLQKTLLGKDEPKGNELDEVPQHLDKLDTLNVDVDTLRETKIGKVLTRINKLDTIPKDGELGVKSRVDALLSKWQNYMSELAKEKNVDNIDSQGPAGKEQTTDEVQSNTAARENNHTSGENGR